MLEVSVHLLETGNYPLYLLLAVVTYWRGGYNPADNSTIWNVWV